jgi:hypothetical protein
MGRLKQRSLTARLLYQLRLWAPPLVISATVIVGVNLTFATPGPTPTEMEKYLQTTDLVTHSEVVDGYQQVYYYYNQEKVFVTNDTTNHTNPKNSGRYIVWLGSTNDLPQQVYLYDLLTNTTLRLSGFGTNSSADLDGNQVVWEQWSNNSQQIAYYDGTQVIQISSGQNCYRPRISGDKIVYVQRVPNDPDGKVWHVIEYDTGSDQSSLVLKTDDGAKAAPHFNAKGQLVTDYDLDYLAS